MEKIRACISIDPVIWSMAGERLPMSRSRFIEEALRNYMNIGDDEGKILQDINTKTRELNALETKLSDVRKRKEEKAEEDIVFNTTMETINRVYKNQNNRIGRNQVNKISKFNGVSPEEITNHLLNEGYELKNFFEPELTETVMIT